MPDYLALPVPAGTAAPRLDQVDRDVLMQELLGPDAAARQAAARRLLKTLPENGVVALVAADAGRPHPPNLEGYPLRLLARDHCAVILPGPPPNLDVLARRLAAQYGAKVGIGQCYPDIRFAYETYREALGAARAAVRLPDLGRVVPWSALGVYRTFAHLPDSVLTRSSVHPGLERLFKDPAHQPLLATLETYLDLAGNVPLAAERLHLHRASLYYRLRRVEQLLQADLRDGIQRLCLHMAFKLGRFTGRYPCRRPGASA